MTVSKLCLIVAAIAAAAVALVAPHLVPAGALLLAVGVTLQFQNSDIVRQLVAWGLGDANGCLLSFVGNGGLARRVVVRLDEQFTIAGIGNLADLTDDVVYTTQIPALSLAKNGDEILVESELLSAANGNNKTAKIILGATTLLTTGVITSNAKNIQLRLRIVRTAAATQLWFATVIVDGVAAVLTKGTGAENLATSLALKLTLASPTTGAASDLLAFRHAVDVAGLAA